MSDLFPPQFSGPTAQNVKAAIVADMTYTQPLIDYAYALSIDTALDTQLAEIGLLIGLPWLSLPPGYATDTEFLFGDSAAFPLTDTAHGLGDSTAWPNLIGGIMGDASGGGGSLIAPALYRKTLKAFARLKFGGLTFNNIDNMAFVFTPLYTITCPRTGFTSGFAYDIDLALTGTVQAANVLLLQQIFSKLCSTPQIFVFTV